MRQQATKLIEQAKQTMDKRRCRGVKHKPSAKPRIGLVVSKEKDHFIRRKGKEDIRYGSDEHVDTVTVTAGALYGWSKGPWVVRRLLIGNIHRLHRPSSLQSCYW